MINVLVVDDSQIELVLIGKILSEDPGITVSFCLDSRKALGIADKCKPDVILLDLNMPHLDGVELRRLLKKNPSTELTPVVFISAETNPDEVNRMFNVGCFEMLSKPINAEELRAVVKENRIQNLHNEIAAALNALHLSISQPPVAA